MVPLFDKSVPDIVFDSRDDLPADSILEYRSLYHGKMVCVMYEEHPLAKHKTVTLEQLNGEVLILLDMAHISARMTTAQELIRQKCPQAVYYFSSSSEHALPMIQGHGGLGGGLGGDAVLSQCWIRSLALHGVWLQSTARYANDKDRLCCIRRIVTCKRLPPTGRSLLLCLGYKEFLEEIRRKNKAYTFCRRF